MVSLTVYFSFVEPSLKVLLNALHPVRAKWYYIGLELDILHTDLENFKKIHLDPLDLMCDVLNHWLKIARPSWEAVVTALRSLTVNEWIVAEQLESKYCTEHNRQTDEFNSSEGSYSSIVCIVC